MTSEDAMASESAMTSKDAMTIENVMTSVSVIARYEANPHKSKNTRVRTCYMVQGVRKPTKGER
tara:strand:+ start:277 stop:468 length:192 start_codon:yes stop_codon:yes gene_type:complete